TPESAGSRMVLRRTVARSVAPPLAATRMPEPSTCWMVLPLMVTAASAACDAPTAMPLQPPHLAPDPAAPLRPMMLSAMVPVDAPLVIDRLTLMAAAVAPVAVFPVMRYVSRDSP